MRGSRQTAPSWDGDCLYEKQALGFTKLQESLYDLEDHKPLVIPEHFLNVMSSLLLARYPLFLSHFAQVMMER